jgi:ATP-dependent Clp protease ATP-binding subunit ClpB
MHFHVDADACCAALRPQVLQLEMERLSLGKAAKSDKGAEARLASLDAELDSLKAQQKVITEQWRKEKDEMGRVQVGRRGG